jgi:hypothetical protein
VAVNPDPAVLDALLARVEEFRDLEGRNIDLFVRALEAFDTPEARAAAESLGRPWREREDAGR